MQVTILFLTGERITWSVAGNQVPRVADALDFSDPAAPRSHVRVEDVTWLFTERGCREVLIRVR